MTYATTVWYMAAWSDEIVAGALKHRKLLDEDIVLFRDPAGVAHALADRCPHRFAPLHMGRCTAEGTVQCGYHGLEFNAKGDCVRNPHGNGAVPRNAKVRSYPIVERHGMIWIWFGDPAAVQPERIADFGAIDPHRAWVARRYLSVKANYVLESDNILDLSHIQYLHPSTLGSSAVAQAHTEVVQEGETVWSKRWVRDESLTPFLEHTSGLAAGQRADRWLDVRWDPAATLLLTVSIGPTGAGRSQARSVSIPHLFTPETATTTHYWFASAFSKVECGDDGQTQADRHVEGLMTPFTNEDMPMLEAQQSRIGMADFWSLKPVLLPSDAAAVRARRVLDALIQREREARVGGPQAAA